MKGLRDVGHFLIVLSVIFAIMETHYFGNNFWPSCAAEWVADLVSLSMSISGARILYLTNE